AGSSIWGMCPTPGRALSDALGIQVFSTLACVTGVMVSLSPQMRVTGGATPAHALTLAGSRLSAGSHAAEAKATAQSERLALKPCREKGTWYAATSVSVTTCLR